MIDFVTTSWAVDEIRYRGEHIRFPAHTPDDAPAGASVPEVEGDYVPQWACEPDTADCGSIPPRPHVPHTPGNVEADDDETPEWAAQPGIPPMVGAGMQTDPGTERWAATRPFCDLTTQPLAA